MPRFPQPHKGEGCRPELTFVVQKVKGAGDILHHHAGLQLIEVAPPMDVGQDGACGGREQSGGSGVGSMPPFLCPSGSPQRCAHLLSFSQTPSKTSPPPQRTQSAPGRSCRDSRISPQCHPQNSWGPPLPPRAHQPTASISPPRGAMQDRRQRGIALQVIESKQPRTPQPHSGDLGLGGG